MFNNQNNSTVISSGYKSIDGPPKLKMQLLCFCDAQLNIGRYFLFLVLNVPLKDWVHYY